MPPAPAQNASQPQSGAGAIVGAIIIVLILIFGALYFWGQRLNKQPAPDAPFVQGSILID